MPRRSGWMGLLRLVVLLLIPVALHWAGVRIMDQRRVMEQLLSPGAHSDPTNLLLAVCFVGLRLMVFLVTPGLFLARIFLHFWEGDDGVTIEKHE